MTNLETVEQFIAAELEQRMAGGESCDDCDGRGWLYRYEGDKEMRHPCGFCEGSGKSLAIAEAEAALEALRVEMERVAELREWAARRLKGLRITRTGHVPADTFCRAVERVLAILDAEYDAPPVEEQNHE